LLAEPRLSSFEVLSAPSPLFDPHSLLDALLTSSFGRNHPVEEEPPARLSRVTNPLSPIAPDLHAKITALVQVLPIEGTIGRANEVRDTIGEEACDNEDQASAVKCESRW
jgi:hypothetical protein